MIQIKSVALRSGSQTYPCDTLVDARVLPNPHHIPELRPLTGKHPQVVGYVVQRNIAAVKEMLEPVLRHPRPNMKVNVGCFGGRHRSVAVADYLATLLIARGYAVEVTHTQLKD